MNNKDLDRDGVHASVARWLAAAEADADRRGMPELKPLLQGLAVSTTALRSADWNERADDDASGADGLSRPGRTTR